VLHRAVRDPFAVAPTSAMMSAVISVDDGAAPDAIRGAAGRLAHAALPELPGDAVAIEVAVAVHRPTLARVGPFWVEESSSTALKAALAAGCLAIAGLAGALATAARRQRLGSSAQ